MNMTHFQGPFNFDQREVFFDSNKGEFWDPTHGVYLDHEIGMHLIDLYFGHQITPITHKKESKLNKKLKKILKLLKHQKSPKG